MHASLMRCGCCWGDGLELGGFRKNLYSVFYANNSNELSLLNQQSSNE